MKLFDGPFYKLDDFPSYGLKRLTEEERITYLVDYEFNMMQIDTLVVRIFLANLDGAHINVNLRNE